MLQTILLIIKFFGDVRWFVTLLEGTPEQQRAGVIAKVKDASQKADDTKGDTSGYESVLGG